MSLCGVRGTKGSIEPLTLFGALSRVEQNELVDPGNDRELVKSYLLGRSEEAFRLLYRAHTPYLFCLALRLSGGRPDEAEDVLQETWIRAAQRMDAFRWQSSLRTWLAGFVINCCRELRRRRPSAFRDLSAPTPDRQSPCPTGVLDLDRLVAALPDGQREVLVLFDVEGYTHEEIAQRLDIARGTSKSRLFEARRTLRRAMTEGAREPGDRP